jgi:hypothetical protein
MNVTQYECVSVALVTQHAMLIRCIILSVVRPFLPYFYTLISFIKGADSRGRAV